MKTLAEQVYERLSDHAKAFVSKEAVVEVLAAAHEYRHRGTGRTTAQILTAPKDAIYVVKHEAHLRHTRDLARSLGRDDLRFATTHRIQEKLMGVRLPVVVDHDSEEFLTDVDAAYIRVHNSKVTARENAR